MLKLIKLILLAGVFLLAFLPLTGTGQIVSIAIIPVVCFLVYLWWRLSFFVPQKAVEKTEPGIREQFGVFTGKVPADPEADLLRGRLVFTENEIKLFSLDSKKHKVYVSFSLKKDDVTSIGFSTVIGKRKGFIIHTEDDAYSFAWGKASKKRDLLFKAMDWDFSEKE